MLQYLTGDICTCNADGRFQKPVAGCPISCTGVEWPGYCPIAAVDAQVFDAMNSWWQLFE